MSPLRSSRKKSGEKEFFANDFAFVAQTSTEDVPVEENFDWNDERRKKYEERQEKHAQYFSPLSAICELIAESNEVEERKARDIYIYIYIISVQV